MEKQLICKFFLFDLHQRIEIFNPETNEAECVAITGFDNIPKVMSEISDKEKIYNIHLYGNSKFAEKLKENILALNAEKYNKNKINIEVN